jgi:hypothetical protein
MSNLKSHQDHDPNSRENYRFATPTTMISTVCAGQGTEQLEEAIGPICGPMDIRDDCRETE